MHSIIDLNRSSLLLCRSLQLQRRNLTALHNKLPPFLDEQTRIPFGSSQLKITQPIEKE